MMDNSWIVEAKRLAVPVGAVVTSLYWKRFFLFMVLIRLFRVGPPGDIKTSRELLGVASEEIGDRRYEIIKVMDVCIDGRNLQLIDAVEFKNASTDGGKHRRIVVVDKTCEKEWFLKQSGLFEVAATGVTNAIWYVDPIAMYRLLTVYTKSN